MATIEEQIEELEKEIANTKKNKATEAHIGKLKAKIAKLAMEKEKRLETIKAGGGSKGFYVKKAGNATVALVGFPSVGKSTLLNQLTGAHSEVGAYPGRRARRDGVQPCEDPDPGYARSHQGRFQR